MRMIDADALIKSIPSEEIASRMAVMNAPTIVERKKGEWIEVDDNIISGRCSVCGWEAILYETDVVGMDYCPNCGADMRGVEE